MPVHLVNLDALIRREDFEVLSDSKKIETLDLAPSLKVVELESDSVMYKLLRKPDFQRTTAHWAPEKVAAFIKSFLEGDLIPAIILWRSTVSGSIFVIDGAHRLSALIAWVHNDYGDERISIPFFETFIPPEQKRAAEQTRKIIQDTVGSYAEIKFAMNSQTNVSPERLLYASTLGASGIKLQWVPGDALRAERSFHTINTEQTPIGEIELRMIRDRRCPNTIATRSLIRAGTGNSYLSSFLETNRDQIKLLAKEIYDDLFVPPLDTPIKTLDLPVAGRGYSSDSVKMILDLVEFINKRNPEASELKKSKRKPKPDILAPTMTEDRDGTATIAFLRNVRKASSRIAGTRPESLGLHPAVYFYSATGGYQPTAFLAAISFVQDLEKKNELNIFTSNRKEFEELLLKYKHFINQIVRHYGSGNRSLTALIKLYRYVFDGTVSKQQETEIVPILIEDQHLAFLKTIVDSDKGIKKDFSSERKSAVYLREAIQKALCCGVCGARVHTRSISIDHKQRKADGGRGVEDNGQLSHPYCNTGYKEYLVSQKAGA